MGWEGFEMSHIDGQFFSSDGLIEAGITFSYIPKKSLCCTSFFGTWKDSLFQTILT